MMRVMGILRGEINRCKKDKAEAHHWLLVNQSKLESLEAEILELEEALVYLEGRQC